MWYSYTCKTTNFIYTFLVRFYLQITLYCFTCSVRNLQLHNSAFLFPYFVNTIIQELINNNTGLNSVFHVLTTINLLLPHTVQFIILFPWLLSRCVYCLWVSDVCMIWISVLGGVLFFILLIFSELLGPVLLSAW